MTQQPHSAAIPGAERVQVITPAGTRVPGWVVRTDTVVAEVGGVGPEATVLLGDQKVEAEETWETTLDITTDQPWTALVLPEGTRTVDSEAMPPQLTPRLVDEDAGMGVRGGFWCVMFPRMRGCRR